MRIEGITTIIDRIRKLEKEENFLYAHKSWGAAEGCNKRKMYQVRAAQRMMNACQINLLELMVAQNLSKIDTFSFADAIEKIMDKEVENGY